MLHLYQSNRLEILFELLAAVVEQPLDAPLAPETVVVQSKGMGRWISLRLAERHGVCANIRFPLPASYLWQLLCEVLGDPPARSAYAPETLTWRVMGWLSDARKLQQVPRLQDYVENGDDVRRFALACRIADTFDQYLVYRPDWITAWEAHRRLDLGPDEDWQALMWRDLSASHPERHRVRLTLDLLARLRTVQSPHHLPERIVLFGISSLPPVFLEVIKALSRHTEVCLFLLNPCREEWGGIRDDAEIARAAGATLPDELYLDLGNPLLASLGKQGREFFEALLADFPQVSSLFEEVRPYTILQTVQSDILNLIDRRKTAKQAIRADDRSVQVHICHSPMREVEVLRDNILALLDADAELEPADIVVLTPDISTYAPYIEAVFTAPEGAPSIPYSIADRSPPGEWPLLDSFLCLLDLPSARFETEWVLDFLEYRAIRRRFDLSGDDIPAIHNWVRTAAIRWGRDDAHKAALGLPPERRHTWREGLDRLLLGYALPQALASDGVPLFQSTLPCDDIEGGLASSLGRFAQFVETLMDYSTKLAACLPLAVWADTLAEMLGQLFLPETPEDTDAIQQLRDALDLLQELAADAGFEESVSNAVVKAWLTRQVRETGGSSGFLTGGVTFGTMVPMRNLPFQVICLLGMNDGDFPRQQRPPGFDLIGRNPRRGDRSRRLDDRYLFLETILSARQTLYISYVGRSIRDNGKLPPSVLVSDLLDAVQASCVLQQGGGCLQHVITEHPLQPFNPAYFEGDVRRPGYSGQWLKAARRLGAGEDESKPLFTEPLPEPEEEWLSVDLDELSYFFGNPARYLLRRRLGLVLEEGEADFDNREPFGLDYFDRDALRELALNELRRGLPPNTARRVAEASGTLPHGDFGRTLFAKERIVAETAAPDLLPLLAEPPLEPISFHFEAAGMRLTGFLSGVRPQGVIAYRLQALGPRDLFALWLRHLALCLLKTPGVAQHSRLIGLDQTVSFGVLEQPEAVMARLLSYYHQGLMRPLPFFIKSAWAYVEAESSKGPERALQAAHAKWDVPEFRNGHFHGESENVWYQFAYRGGDPLDAQFQSVALDILAPMRAAMQEGS
jgi:exodeoxyribonuclease V gamma subunit